MAIFQTRKDFTPMTPAERQRLCRANGKGRHRGRRLTRTQADAYRAEFRRRLEQGADPATAAAAASAAAQASSTTTEPTPAPASAPPTKPE